MAGQRRPSKPRKTLPPQTEEEQKQELKELVDSLSEGKGNKETYDRALNIIMGKGETE